MIWDKLIGGIAQIHLVSSLVGLVFIIGGLLLSRKPPKKINYLYGYRTKRSMANQKAWDFAQRYSGIEMIRLGIIQAIYALSGLVFKLSVLASTIAGLLLMISLVIILFIRTESALKKIAS